MTTDTNIAKRRPHREAAAPAELSQVDPATGMTHKVRKMLEQRGEFRTPDQVEAERVTDLDRAEAAFAVCSRSRSAIRRIRPALPQAPGSCR
jgi:hypothetical protein